MNHIDNDVVYTDDIFLGQFPYTQHVETVALLTKKAQ